MTRPSTGLELNIPVHERTVFLGQSLILQGQVMGHPRAAIVWQHPSGRTLVDDGNLVRTHYGDDGLIQLQVKRFDEEEEEDDQSTLSIGFQLLSVSLQDAGTYQCVATSPRGTIVQKIHVQVKGIVDLSSLTQSNETSRL